MDDCIPNGKLNSTFTNILCNTKECIRSLWSIKKSVSTTNFNQIPIGLVLKFKLIENVLQWSVNRDVNQSWNYYDALKLTGQNNFNNIMSRLMLDQHWKPGSTERQFCRIWESAMLIHNPRTFGHSWER